MWCRKLTENKTVVGGEIKGESERERDKEGTFIYRPATGAGAHRAGGHWLGGGTFWLDELRTVLDYLRSYHVFLSCLHLVHPAYDYQRYNRSVWQCGADVTHLIIEIHPSSALALFASFFFVCSGSSHFTFVSLTSAISKTACSCYRQHVLIWVLEGIFTFYTYEKIFELCL